MKKCKKRKPLIKWKRFERAHRFNERRLVQYQESPRKNWTRISADIREELAPDSRILLLANNAGARIDFARHLSKRLKKSAKQLPSGRPLFWVTLIPSQFLTSEAEAASFNVTRLQAWTRQVVAEANFVGMVEASLFSNLSAVNGRFERGVSWHVHLILWGVTRARMEEIKKAINQRYKSLVPGVSVAKAPRIEWYKVKGKSLYMSKAPQSDHRIIKKRCEVLDLATGEIEKRPTGRFKIRKAALKPGQLVRMCKVMAGRKLDKLAFAGGEGSAILKEVRDQALAPLRVHEKRLEAQADRRRGRPSS